MVTWIQCLYRDVVNAWKLHCFIAASTKTTPMSQLDFKNIIAKTLHLSSEGNTKISTNDDLKNKSHSVPEDVWRLRNLPRVTGTPARTLLSNLVIAAAALFGVQKPHFFM